MILWLDAQISPKLASWISSIIGIDVVHVRQVGLLDAEDLAIFRAAKAAGAVLLTKDEDFIRLVQTLSAPPSVIWLTCGNTSNAELKRILARSLQDAIALTDAGEAVVEISSAMSVRRGVTRAKRTRRRPTRSRT